MSFWGKLGKIGLKVAPIAAGFIPGVGPLASMAIGAGTSALSKKLEGGSWKDAALAGGIGGATGYLGGKIGGKIGPSDPTKYIKNDIAGVASKVAGKGSGIWSKIGNAALDNASPLAGGIIGGMRNSGGGGITSSDLPSTGGKEVPGVAGWKGESFGDFDYRNPDLGAAINRGKRMARIGPTRTSGFVDPRSYGGQRNPNVMY